MDPSKKIGIIKEQVKLENISRRRFPDKWGKLTDKDVNRFYNQNEVNMALRTTVEGDYKEIWPYTYTGHGDSYFVSKDMFKSLVAICRCGRRLTEGHTIKCLQKVQNKYLNDVDSDDNDGKVPPPSPPSSIASGDDIPGKRIHGKYDNEAATNDLNDSLRTFKGNRQARSVGRSRSHIPETSNGMIGWPRTRYSKWEQSTKFVSPISTMHGYKVTEHPYSVIFIG